MLLKLTCIGCVAVMLSLAVAQAQDNDPVLGKLGNYVIRQSDLARFISYSPPSEQKALQDDPEERAAFLRRILEARAVADHARREKFDERPEVKEQLLYIVNQFLSQEYLKKVVMKEASVSEDNLKDFYEQNEEELASPEQVRVRQILIRLSPRFTQEEKNRARHEAQNLLSKLKQGEDFAKIAEIYSEDESRAVRTNGGDFGYFTRGQLLQPIEQVAFSLKPGEISDIIETEYGFHIIKVEDHKERRARSFEEVKDLIRARLQEEYATIKAEESVKDIGKEAGMEIYLERKPDTVENEE